MKTCKDCKFCDYTWEWDGEDERPYYFCQKHGQEIEDIEKVCKKYRKYKEYKETDTICDKCEKFAECKENKIEVTSIEDTKRHYLPDMGVRCEKM